MPGKNRTSSKKKNPHAWACGAILLLPGILNSGCGQKPDTMPLAVLQKSSRDLQKSTNEVDNTNPPPVLPFAKPGAAADASTQHKSFPATLEALGKTHNPDAGKNDRKTSEQP